MKKSFKKYEKAGLPGGPNELKRFTQGFIVSERGQWDYPGLPTAVPTPTGKITMKGVEDDLLGIDNLGNAQYMTPGNEYQFEGDMVYEIPQAKKGGSKKYPKKYSRSLMARNILFTKNPLFKKSKSVKNKIFDPNSPYFQDGGITYVPIKNYDPNNPEHQLGYNSAFRTITYNPNSPIENINNPWWLGHELFHDKQNMDGKMSTYGSVGLRPNPYVASDEAMGAYYDRRGVEFDQAFDQIMQENPDMPEEEILNLAQERMYMNPSTIEGEARQEEQRIESILENLKKLKYKKIGGEIISFDFDDTLSTDRGLEMAQSMPNEKYIISARAEVTPDMIERARAAGISEDRIFATGSDKAKIAKIKELGINRHIDNKQSVINKLGSAGQIFKDGVELPEASYGYSVGNLIRKQDGGFILELDDNEIEEYRKGGYIIEDISVPSLTRMDNGGNPIKQLQEKEKAAELSRLIASGAAGGLGNMANYITKAISESENKSKPSSNVSAARATAKPKSLAAVEKLTSAPKTKPGEVNLAVRDFVQDAKEIDLKSKKDPYEEKNKIIYIDGDKMELKDPDADARYKQWVMNIEDKNKNQTYLEDFGDWINENIFGAESDIESAYRSIYNPVKPKTYYYNGRQVTGNGPWNNYGDAPVQMVYPEMFFMGPSGGAAGLVGNALKSGSKYAKNVIWPALNTALPLGEGITTATAGTVTPFNIASLIFGSQSAANLADSDSESRKSLEKAYNNPTTSNILDAVGNVGLDALGILGSPGVINMFGAAPKAISNLGEFITTKTPLKNTYKYNPWAFKPNPEAAYRMIGDEAGLKDALESGYFRPSSQGSDIKIVHPETYYTMGVPSDTRKYFGHVWDRGYPGPYMTEVSNAAKDSRFTPLNTYFGSGKDLGDIVYTNPEKFIPTNEATIYKQHWLKGYKPIKKSGGLIGTNDNGIVSELTEKEIDKLVKQGYIVEDVSESSLTKARTGMQMSGLDPAFQAKAQQVANNLGVSLEDLIGIMNHESGLNPAIPNPYTGAVGLIQFMPNTAKGLGTSIEALKNMSAIEQLDYVEKFYKPIAGKAKDIGDLYMYTFLPAAVGKPDDFVLGASGSGIKVFGINQDALYNQNKVFDADKKGYYTVGDVKRRIAKFSGRPLVGSSNQSIPGFESSVTRTPGEKTVVKTTIIKDMQNDDWQPRKEEEQVDPRIEQLKTFTKIIEPSLQNINNIYAAAMQQKRFGGNTRMFQDGGMLEDGQDQLLNKPGYGAVGISGSSPVPEYLQPSDVTWYGSPRQMVTAPKEVIYRSPVTGRLQSGQYDPNANQEQLADAATNIRYADVAQGRAESTAPTEEIKLSDRVIKSGNYLKDLKSVKPIKGLARPQGEFYTKEEYEKSDKDKLAKSGYYAVQLKDGNYELLKKEDISNMILASGITPDQFSKNYKIGDSKSITKDFKPVYDYAQQLQAQRVGPMIDELIYSGKSVDQAIKALVAKGEGNYEGIKQKYSAYAQTIKKDADKIYAETLEANKKKKQTEEQRLEDDLLIKNYLNQDTKGLSESQRQMFLNLALSQKETIDKLNSEIDKAQRDAAAGFGSGTRDATATQAYSSRNPYSEATATRQRLGQEKANAAYAADVAKYVITDPKLTEEDRRNILSDPNKFNEAAKAYNEFQNKELKKQFEADQMLARAGRYKPQYQSGVASMIYPEMFFMGPGLGAAGKALTSGLDVLGRASAKSIPGLASIPGATIGNLLGAGFAADAVVNRLLPIPGQLQRGEYAEAATNALTGLFDVGTAGLISPIYKGARSAASELGKFLGTEEGILSNAYKINPKALKEKDVDFLWRWHADQNPEFLSSADVSLTPPDEYTGRWFMLGKPSDIQSYLKLRPGSGTLKGIALRKGVATLPEDAAMFTGSEKLKNVERILPKEYLDKTTNFRIERNPWENYNVEDFGDRITEVKQILDNASIKPHWLKGYKEVPVESTGSLNKSILNKLKPVKPENQLQVFQGNSYVDELPKSYIDQKDINNSYFRQKSWLESDEYLKRRSAATGESPEIIAIDVKNILDRFKNLKIKSGKMLDPKAGGYYDPEKNLIVLNRNSSREEALFMLDHEIKHALSQVATSGNYKNYPVSKIGNKLTNLTQPAFNIYLRDPAEQQVRSLRMLDFIKGKYGIPEGQKLSIEDINRFADDVSSISGGIYADEFLKNYPDVLHHLIGMKQADQKLRFVPKNILKGKSPLKFENQGNLRQNILNQLNKTYMIPAAIVGAGALQQEQDGGMVMDLSDKEIDQYRKGGWIVEEID